MIGPHDAAEELRLLLLAAQIVVQLSEFLNAGVLVTEDLYDLLAGDVFFDIAVHSAERRLTVAMLVFAGCASSMRMPP